MTTDALTIANPQSRSEILFWRRMDLSGLERMKLSVSAHAVVVESTVLCVEDGGFRLDHRWRLTPDFSALQLEVERWGATGNRKLTLMRSQGGWSVNGLKRADLEGALEPDLSVTPFSNTLAIRRMRDGGIFSITLDTCYVDAAAMTVERSRQRYDRLGPNRFRYVDLGRFKGFQSELLVDEEQLVLAYPNLFERVLPLVCENTNAPL